mgnify:CR=1 FL=1
MQITPSAVVKVSMCFCTICIFVLYVRLYYVCMFVSYVRLCRMYGQGIIVLYGIICIYISSWSLFKLFNEEGL